MARVEEFIAVAATKERVLRLLQDLGRRQEILPEGWRIHRMVSAEASGVGAAAEMEWHVGPAPSLQVIQILQVGGDQQIEGPPPGDNYLTTWTVSQHERASLVGAAMEFSYGDLISELFVRRRLRRSMREMLAKLKHVVEAEEREASE